MNETEAITPILDRADSALAAAQHTAYYAWIKHVVSLSVAALTALVSLQSHYVPQEPALPGALAVSWVALLLAIAAGMKAMEGEHRTQIEAANQLREWRDTFGETEAMRLATTRARRPRAIYRYCTAAMPVALLVGLASLLVFAVANLKL